METWGDGNGNSAKGSSKSSARARLDQAGDCVRCHVRNPKLAEMAGAEIAPEKKAWAIDSSKCWSAPPLVFGRVGESADTKGNSDESGWKRPSKICEIAESVFSFPAGVIPHCC